MLGAGHPSPQQGHRYFRLSPRGSASFPSLLCCLPILLSWLCCSHPFGRSASFSAVILGTRDAQDPTIHLLHGPRTHSHVPGTSKHPKPGDDVLCRSRVGATMALQGMMAKSPKSMNPPHFTQNMTKPGGEKSDCAPRGWRSGDTPQDRRWLWGHLPELPF